MGKSHSQTWIANVVMLLLALAVTHTEAKKKVVHELRRWESTGIVNCTAALEFACDGNKARMIPMYQRCDGVVNCKGGSDEKKCTECRTPYSFNGTNGFLECLTAAAMRSNDDDEWRYNRGESLYPKCVVNARKELKKTWKSGCSGDDLRCCYGETCVPASSVCDGIEDCASRWESGTFKPLYGYTEGRYIGGDDEKNCTECTNGAKMCEPTGKCIARKDVCDGANDCEDGSDEKDCTCETCSGSRALCGNGKCIDEKKVCDGVMDCEDASDEQNCPTSCGKPVTANFSLPHIVNFNYKRYLQSEVCSGAFPEVNDRCPSGECDCQTAFQCGGWNKKCISKAQVCDGVNDCYDGSDEQNCLKACLKNPFFKCVNKLRVKCMSMEHKCDGVRDCADGSDEKKCNKCPSDAHKCDGGCLPAASRCNGVKDCKDGSDEKNCTCEECTEGHLDTYSCEACGKCMKKSAACGPKSKCPNPTARDELFCVRHSQRMAKFKEGRNTGDSSRYWSN